MWRAVQELSISRHSFGFAAALDGSVYVMGGNDDSGMPLDNVECLRDGRWHPAPPLNLARSAAGAATLDGCIYAIGGRPPIEISLATASVERFRDDRWEEAPSLNTPRRDFCTAVLDGAIYAIGGCVRRGSTT